MTTTSTNGASPAVADQDGDKRALHCYLTVAAHTQWHTACARQRLSASALAEALGPHLAQLLANRPDLVAEAGEIETRRRRRNR